MSGPTPSSSLRGRRSGCGGRPLPYHAGISGTCRAGRLRPTPGGAPLSVIGVALPSTASGRGLRNSKLYIGVGIDLPSKIIGLHWRRIRPDPGPAPHLKCDLFHRVRLGWRRMRRPSAPVPHPKGHLFHQLRLGWRKIRKPSAPVPHLKDHLFHRIRLGWRGIRAPSAPAPHLKCHLLHRIRLGWHRVGRPSAVAPHLNCHLFHLIRLG